MVFLFIKKTIQTMVDFSYRAKNDSWANSKRVKQSGSVYYYKKPICARPRLVFTNRCVKTHEAPLKVAITDDDDDDDNGGKANGRRRRLTSESRRNDKKSALRYHVSNEGSLLSIGYISFSRVVTLMFSMELNLMTAGAD